MLALILSSFVILTLVFLFMQSSNQPNLSRKAEFIPFESPSFSDEDAQEKGSDSEAASLLQDANVGVSGESEASPEQLGENADAVKINDAKVQTEESISASQASIKRLESVVEEDAQAIESLLKVDINYRIESWRKSWQGGATSDYLSFYSEDFVPNKGLSYSQWQAQRKTRVFPGKSIELVLSDFDVEILAKGKRATAIFTQSYASRTYSDVGRKKLVLVHENDEWNIVSEKPVPVQR